jgi:hypothetical protein
LQLNGKAFDGQPMVMEGSPEVRHRRSRLQRRPEHWPRPAHVIPAMRARDWRSLKIGAAEVAQSPRASRDLARVFSEKLRYSLALPSNKPLQRTQSPQGNWSNINEPLVRRPRR